MPGGTDAGNAVELWRGKVWIGALTPCSRHVWQREGVQMKNALKTMALAMAVVGATAISAAAATLSLVGGGYVTQSLTNAPAGTYDLTLGGNVTIGYLTGTVKNTTAGLASGLSLDGPGYLQYTYIGSEAGNANFSTGTGSVFTKASAVGSSLAAFAFGGGLLDFGFATSDPVTSIGSIQNNGGANPNSSDFAIGFKVADDGQSAFIYFDDIASGDQDFDDFVVRVNVVPVPAAGFLLLGALGGLAALRRRKTA